ncbi:MAG: HDOD domain-containing protein [Burkholderiaceae bacterium]
MNVVDFAHGWATRLGGLDVPMLRRTKRRIDSAWREPDRVDANMLTEIVLLDPLFTMKLLAHANASRSERVVTSPETVCAAILLLGLNAFRTIVDRTPVLEQCIAGNKRAMHRIHQLLRRARRAGRIGLTIAVERQNPDALLIYEAALMHDVVEMLIWIVDTDTGESLLAASREQADPEIGQRLVLGCTLFEIGMRLLQHWQLPSALLNLSGQPDGRDRSTRMAALAIRFAEHAERGWTHASVLTDLRELADLMAISMPAARTLLGRMEAA